MHTGIHTALGVACVLGTTFFAADAGAEAFGTYGVAYERFEVPPVAEGSFFTAGDALADGRLVAATGLSVLVETAVGSRVFAEAARLSEPDFGAPAADPAFLTVSPDGSRIALGGGSDRPVVVFGTGLLDTGAPAVLTASNAGFFGTLHFDAAWRDDGTLALTSGTFGSPSRVDFLDVGSGQTTTVIHNIGGASAGIAFDDRGRLYTGNGFDTEPAGSVTGTIKAFELSAARGTPAPLDFEAEGVFIADVLSASALNFDAQGNLFVGGGDFSGTAGAGFAGVLSADAVRRALESLGPVDTSNPSDLRRVDPLGTGGGFFGTAYNEATGELYVTDGTTWFATVPAPATGPLALLGLAAGGRRGRA